MELDGSIGHLHKNVYTKKKRIVYDWLKLRANDLMSYGVQPEES